MLALDRQGGARPFASWLDVVDIADAAPLGDVNARELLACICLAQDVTSPDFARTVRQGGLPGGRPGKVVARRAARSLLRHLEAVVSPAVEQGLAQTVLAHIYLFCHAQPNLVSDDAEELVLRREHDTRAVQVARSAADPAILALALLRNAWAAHALRDWTSAIDLAREGAELMEDQLPTLSAAGSGFGFGAYQAAGRKAVWASSPAVEGAALACLCWARVRGSAASAGDLETWRVSLERSLPIAQSVRHEQPSHLLSVFTGMRGTSRRTGSRDGFKRVAEILQSWLLEDDLPEIRRGLVVHQAYDARSLGDWERAATLHRQRVDMLVEGFRAAPPPRSAPAQYEPVTQHLIASGSSSVYNAVGNSAFEIGQALWESRGAAQGHDAPDDVRGWLDLAELIWRSYGHNGLFAVKLFRARLTSEQALTVERAAATDAALDVSRRALNAPLRQNAAIFAARTALPGDPRIADSLTRLLEDASLVPSGRLLAARGLWWRRCAEQAPHTEQAGIDAWHRAEDDSLQGLRRLRVEDLIADPEWAAEAWWTTALAANATLAAVPDERRRIQLDRLVGAVECVGQMLISITDLGHRARLAHRFGPVVRAALEIAVELNSPDAVDLVLETVRRDRVGLLITELRRDPRIGEQLRDVLQRLVAAQTATLEEADSDTAPAAGESAPSPAAQDRAVRAAASAVASNRVAARAAADEALGIIGALTDAGTVKQARARDALRERGPGRTVALLQLQPSTAAMLRTEPSAEAAWLARRLTLVNDAGTRREWTDRVPLPPEVTTTGSSFGPGTWQYKPETFLPLPLMRELERANRRVPVRLLIVPSDLYRLPFDALVMPGGRRHLIDLAAVSLHPSLTVIQRLLGTHGPGGFTRGAVSYDTERLTHAEPEYAALRRSFQPLDDIAGRQDFHRILRHGSALSLLALSVHGTSDAHGWGQAKQLPNGETVTAAESLALTFPSLCVLASCYSGVETRDGVELAGFPLAMFARGADTIVGSLYAIEDQSTSEIMQLFWPLLASGDPIHALRTARLDWLNEDPRRRRSPHRWAGLVAYGGAHL